MGIFDGCLLTSDVDDTLVSSGNIPDENIKKIEFFMREGGMFSVATGRAAGGITAVTDAIERFSPSVVANGCMIYDYENRKILFQEILPNAVHSLIKTIIDLNLNIGIELHANAEAYTLLRTSETDFHQWYENFKTEFCDFEDVDLLDWNKIVFFAADVSQFDKIKEIVDNSGIELNTVSTCMFFEGNKHSFLEILPYGVSKASAIRKLREMFNIKSGCHYAIGDYYNDIEMLKIADISAVTSASPEEVKKYADYITVECQKGAVADFIDYLTEKQMA